MDGWVAGLSDGTTITEEWVGGALSPWQRLMIYCKNNKAYVTSLFLTVSKSTYGCPNNARGYWQAHGMLATQGLECDEDLHKWRGIGWVPNDIDIVMINGATYDPITHKAVWAQESRICKDQAQIIWAKGDLWKE